VARPQSKKGREKTEALDGRSTLIGCEGRTSLEKGGRSHDWPGEEKRRGAKNLHVPEGYRGMSEEKRGLTKNVPIRSRGLRVGDGGKNRRGKKNMA